MDLADEFRVRAERCLKLGREAPTLEAQTHWLAMAQLWLSLAQHAEEQEAAFLAAKAPPGNGKKNGHKKNGDQENGDH